VKNLNSMKAVVKALQHEVKRQAALLDSGGPVERETRLWNDAAGRTERMRSKEEAHDYRYFPEPDLVPCEIDEEWLERLRAELPEPPIERRARLERDYSLSTYEAQVLTDDRDMADYFEDCVRAGASPKSAANWLMNVVSAILNERKIGIAQFEVKAGSLAELVQLADEGKVTASAARDVLARMIKDAQGGQEEGLPTPSGLVDDMGLGTISGGSELEGAVDEAIASSAKAVKDYLKGKEAALGAIMGQVMRLTKGKADPGLAAGLLRQKLDAMKGSK